MVQIEVEEIVYEKSKFVVMITVFITSWKDNLCIQKNCVCGIFSAIWRITSHVGGIDRNIYA